MIGDAYMPKLLTFAEKTNPILRQTMPPVKDFNDPELHEIIADMCYSIFPEQLKKANGAHDSAAGMAANQWGIKKRIFIFTPNGSQEGEEQEVMINPSYLPYLRPNEKTPTLTPAFEGCFSVPLTTGIVRRYESIMAIYYTPQGKKVERLMEGWEARVFQHETDHLNGKLFDGTHDDFPGPECPERILFKDKEEMQDFWKNKVRPDREK